jgi:signal transduction histidine kinase/CheY-like chemotaxis protein
MSEKQALVLVVDDNEINRDVLSRRIARYGHQVVTAVGGREALRMMTDQAFDLVLLDIMMPDMNGYQVLERIKQDPDLQSVPVIVISALDDIDSVVKCIKLGAEDYLSKPFNPMLLRARIGASLDKKWLRDRQQEYLEEQALAQRIDGELNNRLDIRRVCQITLDWAWRRVAPDSALIGIIRDPELGLEIIENRGCEARLAQYANGHIPLASEVWQKAVRTILPQSNTEPAELFLPEAARQIVIPIGRSGEAQGLLVLESRYEAHFDNRRLTFLTRLCDRAAIALSNAMLYEQVQAANLAKSQFVSTVSHELKNPMTSIMNYAKMIPAMGPVNEMQAQFVQTITNNVQRMARLVSDLSDLSQIEAGHLSLSCTAVDVYTAVDEVLLSFRTQLEDKQQQLHLQLSPDIPPVWGDHGRILQILTNLVSNAHKYTPAEGQIFLTAQPSPNGNGNQIQIAVQDTGIGLRPEDQEKIFQRYFRAADDKAQASPGTGLGLNITKMLVELQGGHIWFESRFREGTTFYFTLPVAPAPSA